MSPAIRAATYVWVRLWVQFHPNIFTKGMGANGFKAMIVEFSKTAQVVFQEVSDDLAKEIEAQAKN